MFKIILISSLATIYSCASTSAEWSSWKARDVAQDDQVWRRCSADKDLPARVNKGECYVSQECRTRTPWYSGVKTECRRLDLFCAWGDIECMVKYDTFNNVIVDKERLK